MDHWRVVDERQNFYQILPTGRRGNLEWLTIIYHNCYQNTVIFVSTSLKWKRCHDQFASIVMHPLKMRKTLSFIVMEIGKKESWGQSRCLYYRKFLQWNPERWETHSIWMKEVRWTFRELLRYCYAIRMRIWIRVWYVWYEPNGQTDSTSK